MFKQYNKTATAALVAALMFILSLSSCKKDDSSNPSPADTTAAGTCRLDIETDPVTGDTVQRFEYDSQDSVSLYQGEQNYDGLGTFRFTAIVTYLDANNIEIFKTYRRSGNPQIIEHYFLEGGILRRVTFSHPGSDYGVDTAFYDYRADGKLARIRHRKFREIGSEFPYLPGNDTEITDWVGDLPAVVVESSLDTSWTATPTLKTTYTYDTQAVAYNPHSLFNILPNLQPVKINRMFLTTREDDLQSGGSTSYIHTNSYNDRGNPTESTTTSIWGSFRSRYGFTCR